MDWSRVKTILIIALLLTNVFLIATLDLGRPAENEVEDESVLIGMLEEHGIFVDTEIPKVQEDMGTVVVKYADLDDDYIKAMMAEVRLNTRNELTEASYKNAADKFLEDIGLYTDSVNIETISVNGSGADVYYNNVVDGVKFDGCCIRCSFRGDRMTDFEYEWFIPVSVSGKMSTISASVALMRFMSEHDASQEVHINNIEAVYWLEESEENDAVVTDTAFAYWKISYNESEAKYIIAYEQ